MLLGLLVKGFEYVTMVKSYSKLSASTTTPYADTTELLDWSAERPVSHNKQAKADFLSLLTWDSVFYVFYDNILLIVLLNQNNI